MLIRHHDYFLDTSDPTDQDLVSKGRYSNESDSPNPDSRRPEHCESGSEAVWSDGGRTYALLFQGGSEQMHAHMDSMGITS
jgi:hypothetical protein